MRVRPRGTPPRRALVVGGSEGIGLAIAERLVARGADVHLASRSRDKLDAAVAGLEAGRDGAAGLITTTVLDVTDPQTLGPALARLISEQGAPDLVVNTAGYARPGWLEELPDADVTGMVEANLLGTIHLVRAVLPHLGRGSRVLLTSSMAGLTGVFGHTVYCATKFGVVGFAEALRRELHPRGIVVQVLCPPNTLTPGFEEEGRHKPPEVLAAEETVATLTADEVAEAALRGLAGRRLVLVPGASSRAGALAVRHLPRGLVDRTMRRLS